jgi:hypothetical protein
LLGIAGVGVQGALGRGSLRAELGARFDMDDGSDDDFDDDLDDVFDNDNDDSDAHVDGYVGLSFCCPWAAAPSR